MTESEFYRFYHRMIYVPDHIYADKGGCVYEHRLEAEEDCGRPILPTEIVHHHYLWDGSCYLAVCKNKAEHMKMHVCEEAFRYSGHWDWRKCYYCKQYDDIKNLTITKYSQIYHKLCAAKYYHKRKEEKANESGR